MSSPEVHTRFDDTGLCVSFVVENRLCIADAMFMPLTTLVESDMRGLTVLKDEPNLMWFCRLSVPPSLRTRGLGTLLLDAVISALHKHNLTLVCIPSPSNPKFDADALTQFYCRHGFEVVIPPPSQVLVYYGAHHNANLATPTTISV